MAKKTARITSITEAAADRFAKCAKDAETLGCEMIPGFLLRKLTKNCAWRYRYTDPTGKRRVYSFAKFPAMKPNEAATIALDWHQRDADPFQESQQAHAAKRQAMVDSDARTLRKYLEGDYQQHMEAWKDRNAKANQGRFNKQFAKFMDRDIATLTKQDMKRWQKAMQDRGLAHSTIRREFAALRALLNQAVADGVLNENPLLGYKLLAPTHKEQQRTLEDPEKAKRRMLKPAELKGILSGLDKLAEEIRAQRRNSRKHGKPYLQDLDSVEYPHWFIPYCHLALATGWRPSDLYTLKWEEVDLKFTGTLRKFAEKSKDVALRRGKEPTILENPLPASAKAMLTKWHKQQGKPDTGLVFPSPHGGGQLTSNAHLKPWAEVKALGKVTGSLEFYALRHHAISVMVAAGVPLLTVAKLAGHKSVAMIERNYGHLCPVSAAKAVDIVAATIPRATTSKRAAQ